MNTYKDERREFVEEMKRETYNERVLLVMAAIVSGNTDALHIVDSDDFDGPEREALEAALKAEDAEDIGDWECARSLAQVAADMIVEDYMGAAVFDQHDTDQCEDAQCAICAKIDPHQTEDGKA